MSGDILPPIAYGDLLAHLGDPESDLAHFVRYMVEIPVPGRAAPELEPNPGLVTGIPPRVEGGIGMGLANSVMRARRHKAYAKRIASGWTGHRIVSEGDSWFQYPTALQDIIDHLMKDHAILSLGAAGDELEDIQSQREILMNAQAQGASAVLLSAGGNDLFDNGQLGQLVEEPFPGAGADDLIGPVFDRFLAGMSGRYLALFRRIHRGLPHVHVLIHGYGPAFPRGGAWIQKPLTKRGVPLEIQHDVVKVILRKFNRLLATLAARSEFHGKIGHVDVTDIGTRPGDWHDEIHLNGANAAKVADRFRRELKRRLGSPVVESAIAEDDALVQDGTLMLQAERLAVLDEQTLLRELDLRVALLEMDPTVADEVELTPLVIGRAEPELGIASLRRFTRRLINRWEADLHTLICDTDTAPGNPVETAIIDALGKSKTALAGAIASWLASGPLAVPAVLATALAAWLATKVFDRGKAAICAVWQPDIPTSPVPVVLTEAAAPVRLTVGELRARFETPDGARDFSKDGVKDALDHLDAELAHKVVEAPRVPVDADGAAQFRKGAAQIFELLGGAADDALVDDGLINSAEAIIMTDGSRPSQYVQDGFVDMTDPNLVRSGWKDRVAAHEADIRALAAASGRIIRGSDRSGDSVYGSAWMLKDGRVATARHVLEGMGAQIAGQWMFKDDFFVDFNVEAGAHPDPARVFRIAGVDWTSDDLIAHTVNPAHQDVAVLTLQPRAGADFPDPVALADGSVAEALKAQKWFFNIGHPAAPFGSWLVAAEDGNPNTISRPLLFALIGDKFGVKRLSPGRMDFMPGTIHGDALGHVFTHDGTTLGGSSGSAIMAIGPNGAVISGLHFAGIFGTRNYAHWIPAVPDIHT